MNVLRLKLISSVSQITRRLLFDSLAKYSEGSTSNTPKKKLYPFHLLNQVSAERIYECFAYWKKIFVASNDFFFFKFYSYICFLLPRSPRISGWTIIFSITLFCFCFINLSWFFFPVLLSAQSSQIMWNTNTLFRFNFCRFSSIRSKWFNFCASLSFEFVYDALSINLHKMLAS